MCVPLDTRPLASRSGVSARRPIRRSVIISGCGLSLDAMAAAGRAPSPARPGLRSAGHCHCPLPSVLAPLRSACLLPPPRGPQANASLATRSATNETKVHAVSRSHPAVAGHPLQIGSAVCVPGGILLLFTDLAFRQEDGVVGAPVRRAAAAGAAPHTLHSKRCVVLYDPHRKGDGYRGARSFFSRSYCFIARRRPPRKRATA